MSVGQDVTFAVRSLRRSPVFAFTAVASLAIGIAGNATIFSLADALLLRPKPGLSDPARLVDVGRTDNGEGFDTFSYPDYLDYRERATVFEDLAAYREGEPFGLSIDGRAVRVFGGQVSANYFDVTGTTIALGRGFLPQEERITDPRTVVVISDALWSAEFGRDPDVIGRTIRLNDLLFTVIGVTTPGFTGYSFASEALWVPLTAYPEGNDLGRLTRRDSTWLNFFGRLKSGATVAQAGAELDVIARALAREYPDAYPSGRGIAVAPSATVPQSERSTVTGFIAVLFGLVGLILLIVCTNIGGMLLARGMSRSREVGLRLALGADRSRIVRLLVTESVLLAVAGTVAGIAAASAVISLFYRLLPVLPIDVAVDFRVDWRVVTFSVLVALGAALLSGLVPALQASRLDLTSALKPDRASGRPRRLRARQAFVVAQISLSVLLVVCTLLLARSLGNAIAIDPGFTPDDVDLAGIDLRLGGYDNATGPVFAEQLVSRMEQLPGVVSAASTRVVPLTMSGYSEGWLWLPEHQGDMEHAIRADWNLVTPGYFETIGTPIVRGRAFEARDDSKGRDVVIVNETLAARVWPGENPIGRSLVYGRSARALEVVGIARDAKYQTLGEERQPFVYVPLAQHYHPEMWLLVRTTGPSVLPALRELVHEMSPNLPLVRASTLTEATAFGLVPTRFAAWLAAIVGTVGLALAALGLYGITAYNAGQRRREIGVRMAVGALRAQVMRMMMRQAMTLAAAGVFIGIGLAAAGAQVLRTLLYGVEPLDPASFAGGALLLAAVAVVAGMIPARRAASVNPVDTLKGDQ